MNLTKINLRKVFNSFKSNTLRWFGMRMSWVGWEGAETDEASKSTYSIIGLQHFSLYYKCFFCFFFFNRWKNPDNEFRKHPKTLLKSIPTLIRWGTVSEWICFYANPLFLCSNKRDLKTLLLYGYIVRYILLSRSVKNIFLFIIESLQCQNNIWPKNFKIY